MEQRTIIYREWNRKKCSKNSVGSGISVTKNTIGNGKKAEDRISPNHENMWDLGRKREMKKIIMGKGSRKLVEQLF